MCAGMPYLDIRENHEALVLVQTVHDNFGKFTERQVQRAIASREMQARVAYRWVRLLQLAPQGAALLARG